jgi:hypothetical protein
MERIGVVAAREQDGGLEKLLASGLNEAQVNAIKLTPDEQKVLDTMRATFEKEFPEIQGVMRDVYNQPVEKVKNYFSFMTDFKAMTESEIWERGGPINPEQFGAPRKNIKEGSTIARTGGAQKIKLNAMDIFLNHTDNTSYLIEMGEDVKLLSEVASSPEFLQQVGDAGTLLVKEWLDVIARKGGAAGAVEMAGVDWMRKNVGAAILGAKLSTILIQPTSIFNAAGFIGSKYTALGVTDFATSKEWRQLVLGFPEIADRMGGEAFIRELAGDDWWSKVQRKGFVPMQKMDQITAGSVAAGAYRQKMAELGLPIDFNGPVNKEAMEYAQLAVRRTQSTGSFKDVPLAISRGALTNNRSVDRALLQFQNYGLNTWSRVRHDAIRAGINTKNPKKAIQIMSWLATSILAAAGVRVGLDEVQDLITGKKDDKEPGEEFVQTAALDAISNVPFLGQVAGMAIFDGDAMPLLSAPKDAVQGLIRALTSNTESAKLRGITDFIGGVGSIAGVPGTYQAKRLVRDSIKDEKKTSSSSNKRLPTPPGLPSLSTSVKRLPTPPGLPKL